jgi:hypothetical protein
MIGETAATLRIVGLTCIGKADTFSVTYLRLFPVKPSIYLDCLGFIT